MTLKLTAKQLQLFQIVFPVVVFLLLILIIWYFNKPQNPTINPDINADVRGTRTERVDLVDYFKGELEQKYYLSSGEMFYTVDDGSDGDRECFKICKTEDCSGYERFCYDDVNLYHYEDTTWADGTGDIRCGDTGELAGFMLRDENGRDGAIWASRFMEEGECTPELPRNIVGVRRNNVNSECPAKYTGSATHSICLNNLEKQCFELDRAGTQAADAISLSIQSGPGAGETYIYDEKAGWIGFMRDSATCEGNFIITDNASRLSTERATTCMNVYDAQRFTPENQCPLPEERGIDIFPNQAQNIVSVCRPRNQATNNPGNFLIAQSNEQSSVIASTSNVKGMETVSNSPGTSGGSGIELELQNNGSSFEIKGFYNQPEECGDPSDAHYTFQYDIVNSSGNVVGSAGGCDVYLTGTQYFKRRDPSKSRIPGDDNYDPIALDGYNVTDINGDECDVRVTPNELEQSGNSLVVRAVVDAPNAGITGNPNCSKDLRFNCNSNDPSCALNVPPPTIEPQCRTYAGPSTNGNVCAYDAIYYDDEAIEMKSCESLNKSTLPLSGFHRLVQTCEDLYVFKGAAIVTEQVTNFPSLNYLGSGKPKISRLENIVFGTDASPYAPICSIVAAIVGSPQLTTNNEHDGKMRIYSGGSYREYVMPKLGSAVSCLNLLAVRNPLSRDTWRVEELTDGFNRLKIQQEEINEANELGTEFTEDKSARTYQDYVLERVREYLNGIRDILDNIFNFGNGSDRDRLPGEPYAEYEEVNYCIGDDEEALVKFVNKTASQPSERAIGPEQVADVRTLDIDVRAMCASGSRGGVRVEIGGAPQNPISFFCNCLRYEVNQDSGLQECVQYIHKDIVNEVNAIYPNYQVYRSYSFSDLPEEIGVPGLLSGYGKLIDFSQHIGSNMGLNVLAPPNGIEVEMRNRLVDPFADGYIKDLSGVYPGAVLLTNPYGPPKEIIPSQIQDQEYQFILPFDHQQLLTLTLFKLTGGEQSEDFFVEKNKIVNDNG